MPALRSLLVPAVALAAACDRPVPAPLPPLALGELYRAAGPGVLEPDEELEAEWNEVVHRGWSGRRPRLERLLDDGAQTLAVLHGRIGAADELASLSSAGHQPRLTDAARLTRLLLLEGRRRQASRDDDGAMASALAALRFAHRHLHERDVPLVVHVLGTSLQREALDLIRAMIHRSDVSDEAWRRCLAELSALRGSWPDLEPRVRHDTRCARQLVEDGFREQGTLDAPKAQSVLAQLDRATAEYLQELANACREGRPELLRDRQAEGRRAMEGPAALFRAVLSEEEGARMAAELIVQTSFPDLATVVESDMIQRMALDMERVAVAVRLAWFALGQRPPISLEELVPEYLEAVPEDLFAPGEPLGLARDGRHWWVYSVGPDRADDGGQWRYSALRPDAGGDLLSIPEQRN